MRSRLAPGNQYQRANGDPRTSVRIKKVCPTISGTGVKTRLKKVVSPAPEARSSEVLSREARQAGWARRGGTGGLVALVIAVFPANLYMAMHPV
jgi:hypothetical protein